MANLGQVSKALSADDLKSLERLLAPMVDEWVANTVDGAKVLAAYRTEIAKIRKK
jgi:hypothetical protein